MKRTLWIAVIFAFLWSASPALAAENYEKAQVTIIHAEEESVFSGLKQIMQTVELEVLTGTERGHRFTIENNILGNRDDMRLNPGEIVVVQKLEKIDGSTQYLIREKYRLRWIGLLAGLFVLLVLMIGKMTGIRSLAGLIVSIGVLGLFIVPQIATGKNPLLVSLVGSCLIALLSIYLAHGISRRTTVALLSTMITLAITIVLAVAAVSLTMLFGMGTEETMFLQLDPARQINLRGLLLGGIVIGALGVLDDITTAQTAAIYELKKANLSLSAQKLYSAGSAIGREHIASLINTLALAYVGTSLPLLLLFHINRDAPVWVILNSEFIAEEIVRTIIGSAALVLAVPISTWMAVVAFHKQTIDSREPATHVHHHG